MSRNIDDIGLRKILKDERFGDKRTTVDDYTGEKLYKDNAGLSRTHSSKQVCNDDHVNSIDVVNKKYGDLSEFQRSELANDKSNIVYTNASLNKSKGAMTNAEYVKKQRENGTPLDRTTEKNMIKAQIKSDLKMNLNATKMRIENKIDDKLPSVSRKSDRFDPEDDDDFYDV